MRSVSEHIGIDGTRTYKVRYRRADGAQSSETFRLQGDAEMFRDILGNGKNGRLVEALKWLEQRRAGDTASVLTFGQWWKQYMAQLTAVTPRTRGDYESLHRRYTSRFDALPLSVISRTHVAQLVNDMEAKGRAPKTIKGTINGLSTCMKLAIDEGHITANPCRGVRLPSQSLTTVEPRFLSDDEFRMLMREIPTYYKPLVAFLFGTGMRWSEATAIETRHVNLAAGTVRVEQAWKRIPGDGYKIGVPKTKKAKRTVNAAVIALAAAKPLMGKPRDLLFQIPGGGHVTHSNFYNNVWRPACKRAKLDPSPRIHDARHTHASWLISDGQSLEAVQDQLGHESIETTRKVYAHLLPAVGVAVGKAASAALERALGEGATGVMPALPPAPDHPQADE